MRRERPRLGHRCLEGATRLLHPEALERRDLLAASVLVGDFDGDGVDTIGFYDPAPGDFFFSQANQAGVTEQRQHFGPQNSTYLPLVGDWDGDGVDTMGLFDPFAGRFFLKNTNGAGPVDVRFRFGPIASDWLPLSGDFNGDGRDGVALYNRANARAYVNESFTDALIDDVFSFGKPGAADWVPLVGDWDGDGDDGLGVYRPEIPVFYFQNTPGPLSTVDESVFYGAGSSGVVPLVGDWDGDGVVTVGAYEFSTNSALLSNQAFAGNTVTTVGVDAQFFVGPLATLQVPATKLTSLDVLIANAPLEKKTLSPDDVEGLLQRAAAASASNDAVIAVVDRNGRILGVRAEQQVLDDFGIGANPNNADLLDPNAAIPAELVFAIDGAVAKARTAAYFANNTAPLSSRLIRFISQSTITQREVQSNPNVCNPSLAAFNEFTCGPGFVAPIGLGGHFPPEVPHTPVVDLFAIEHTNRDSIVHPGANGYRAGVTLNADGSLSTISDDILLPSRFNVPAALVPPGQEIFAPESYGFVSGELLDAQARGIATLPGGIAVYKNIDPTPGAVPEVLVGGIGVFFPRPPETLPAGEFLTQYGFATHEQGFRPGPGQTEKDRTNSDRTLESEAIAFSAVTGDIPGVASLPGIGLRAILREPPLSVLPRLTLVGIELEVIGPHPDNKNFFTPGPITIARVAERVRGNPAVDQNSGANLKVNPQGDTLIAGKVVPEGWLVPPRDAVDPDSNITAVDVQRIVANAINEANKVRAAIRLQPDFSFGARTRMVMSVADKAGNVLGLYRMPDATYFSIDVAVAKARNTSYYADATAIGPNFSLDGVTGAVPGDAFSNRTFRYLAEPRFPDGVEFSNPAPFSILTDPGMNRAPTTAQGGAQNVGPPLSSNYFTNPLGPASVLGFDAFNPGSNFRDGRTSGAPDPQDIANQNGIVFFPGSTPVYGAGNQLIGGFGVSGDGVDQDDVVTFFGAQGFFPAAPIRRGDQVYVDGVRLPFIKFLRNPEG